MAALKIENEFGQKIGGSRRDQWNPGGIDLNDAAQMNDAEKAKYIKKDNVWPKPDYQALVDEGYDVEAAYFIKQVRDSVAVSPIPGKETLYIEAVGKVRDAVLSVKERSQIETFRNVILNDPYWVEDGRCRWSVKVTDAVRVLGSSKFFSAMQSTESRCRAEIKKKMFLFSEDEKLFAESKAIIFVRTSDPEQFKPTGDKYCSEPASMVKVNSYCSTRANGISPEDGNRICQGRYILILGYRYAGVFDSYDEAKTSAVNVMKAARKATPKTIRKGKKTFCYEALENLVQTSEPATGITGENYLNTFLFYGGEFGNWLNNDERQKNLDLGFVAFRDLAKALGIPERAIAFGGKLAIAFGARGKGNALAHFEPLRNVINLTKLRGAGSLAHEYGHALDFIMGAKFGLGCSFMEQADKRKYRPNISNCACPEFNKVVNAMLFESETSYARTQYWKESIRMAGCYSKQGGYWDSCVEMFARAFACYVSDKLEAMGIKNSYLCGHADLAVGFDADGSIIRAYPTGDERKRINAAFDELISVLRPLF